MFPSEVEGYTGVEGWGGMLGSGSFHSFLPRVPLASPTSSQRLKEARCRQDNHHLIRGYIESRLELIHYKLERRVHTHTHPHMYTWVVEYICTPIVRAGVIMVHDDTLQKEVYHSQSVHMWTSMCTKNTLTCTYKHMDTHTRSFFLLLTLVLYRHARKMLAYGKRY